ncbi:MAG: DUF5677 domain-containing protein [Candidatus Humimicrobiaceae bacterium]
MENIDLSFRKLIEELINFSEVKNKDLLNFVHNSGNLLLENIFAIYIGIFSYIKAIKEIVNNGNVAAGNVLLRSIFEGLINIRYIAIDKTQLRAVAFELNDLNRQKKFILGILNGPSDIVEFINNTQLSTKEDCNKKLTEIENNRREYLSIFKSHYKINIQEETDIEWGNDIFVKAKQVGLESEYRTIYQYLCGFAHLDTIGIKTFFQLGNGEYKINIQKDEKEIEVMLGATCTYYIKVLVEVLKNFGFYSENEFKNFITVFDLLNKRN